MNITDNILPPAAIVEALETIKGKIEAYKAIEEARKVVDFQSDMISLQALATEAQSSAKFWLLEAVDKELDRQASALKDAKVPPSIAKLRADAKCREWHYIYEKSQRYSANISHALEGVRTKISYLKEEMRNV